ncbi:bifunctional hydroxymethylpyrimidine kinase/phosphomethylpyrimidine kinase [Prevotella copri]|uniref:hydroxymethylpyrimidine/phosphomethylpyrimidine kinase n=1 Tax=Segatella copri TaxID=165179 RepID=UPI001C38B487|nr:hydroxymethylpyrimidine/phosphomethylpyrimidine kinase [Segatella copri]MBV3413225.1 bifunctional hydroxymethylpyrimidine kinase/phosphomethylpyrimidine kinase [Segatella copri]
MKVFYPILTITGSDSTGGSGVQADIKTISELGGYAVSAITSITVQNTLGIQEFFDVPAEIVSGQIEAIMNDIQPTIVKVGMIRRVETLGVVIDALTKYRPDYIIYTPAIWSSNGDALMTEDVVSQIRYRLLPLCSVVVARKKENDIILQDTKLLRMAEGNGMQVFLLDNANSHGLTNRFSSALAVYLNQGKKMEDALAMAQDFINVELTRESNLQGRSSELYNQFISQVNNFCRTYSDVHFYADQLNVSSRYLAQVTRRISCKTPKAIIDEYIVKEIERELSTTTHTVQEIANTFGFSSQAHLTKFFKKMKGVTPSAFRQPKPVD